jgi:hypothetical protein
MVGTKPICEPTMRRRASAWRSSATLCTTSVIVVERTWNSSGHVIEVAEHRETVVAELVSPMTRDDVGRELLERREDERALVHERMRDLQIRLVDGDAVDPDDVDVDRPWPPMHARSRPPAVSVLRQTSSSSRGERVVSSSMTMLKYAPWSSGPPTGSVS